MKFIIILKWKDDRITYQNLKSKSYLNALKPNEIESVWIPQVIFRNTDDNDATTLHNGIKKIDTSITVLKEGNFTGSQNYDMDEVEFVKGKENPIMMNQTYTKYFHFSYKFQFFPFDTQVKVKKKGKYVVD